RGDALLAGLLLGGSALVKNEGTALLAIAGASLGLFWLVGALLARREGAPDGADAHPHRRAFLDLAMIFSIAAIMIAPWQSIRGKIPSIDEDYPTSIKLALGLEQPTRLTPKWQPRSVAQAVERVPVVLGGYLAAGTNVLRWNLVWILFPATVLVWTVLRPVRLLRHPVAPLLTAIAMALGAYSLILVVTPWELPHLYSTAIPDRIVLHIAPLVIVCTLALMWRFPEEWSRDDPPTEGADARPNAEPATNEEE
ncbi:MAG: hypothetical protein R3F34_14635, partial [Planctomycetota bacterium]